MSLLSKKLEQDEWLSFVKSAHSEHALARQSLDTWINEVDLLIVSRKLEEDYNPSLGTPLWLTNLKYFFTHLEKAKHLMNNAISRVGMPKLHVNHVRTYTAFSMNEDVSHWALTLVFLLKVRDIASRIYCSRNDIDEKTFEPSLRAAKGNSVYLAVFDARVEFYSVLLSGNDVASKNKDLSEGDLIRRVDELQVIAESLPRLIDKFLTESSSFLPWILGESPEIDLSSFNYDQV